MRSSRTHAKGARLDLRGVTDSAFRSVNPHYLKADRKACPDEKKFGTPRQNSFNNLPLN